LVLVILSPGVSGEVDDAASVEDLYRELVAMDHAVRKGREQYWTISEGAANAYLHAVVEQHGKDKADSWRRLVLARVDFQDQAVRLTLHHKRGPMVLSQQLDLTHEEGSGWTLQALHLGKLPIPPVVRDRAAAVILKAFSAFERDIYVLRNVSEVHLDNEKAYLVNRRNPV